MKNKASSNPGTLLLNTADSYFDNPPISTGLIF
jgi:hypothetical protein